MERPFKANIVDKYLQPVRMQIVELIESSADVVEYGCGNGDLLFKLSDKVNSGVGIDNSKSLISYANSRKEKEGKTNLGFSCLDLRDDITFQPVDYSIASLFFHIIPWGKSVQLLRGMVHKSKTTIVCGFSEPQSRKEKYLLWVDQRFSGHYTHFKNFTNRNFTEGLLSELHHIEYTRFDTFDPVIKIYKITKLNSA